MCEGCEWECVRGVRCECVSCVRNVRVYLEAVQGRDNDTGYIATTGQLKWSVVLVSHYQSLL